jgi:hypothetical protein
MSKSNLADVQRAILSLTPEELQAFTLWFVSGRPAPTATPAPRPREAPVPEQRPPATARVVPKLPEGWQKWPKEKLEDLEENLQALARDEDLSSQDKQELQVQLKLVARAIQ